MVSDDLGLDAAKNSRKEVDSKHAEPDTECGEQERVVKVIHCGGQNERSCGELLWLSYTAKSKVLTQMNS